MKFSRLALALNPLAKRLGFYTAYKITTKEFIGLAEWPNLDCRLRSLGYIRPPTVACIPLSAAKTHPVTGSIHDLTLRKVDPNDNRRQYHVHAFRMDSMAAIASHYELRPDLCKLAGETHEQRKQRLATHYRPVWGSDYIRGSRCDRIDTILKG